MVEETIKSIRETENKADQIVKEAEQESKGYILQDRERRSKTGCRQAD